MSGRVVEEPRGDDYGWHYRTVVSSLGAIDILLGGVREPLP